MKPKTMILMVVAVGCGLGASYMTSKLLADRGKAVQEVETVPVLVAKVRVPSWQPIKEPEKFFEVQQFPETIAPKKAIGDLEKVKDQRLRNFLEEGKPLTQDDLVNKDQMGLEVQLQPGQRATALKVNAEQVIGGFILPGCRVDVVCTTRDGEKATKLILQNMLVLAADTVDSKNPDTKTILAQTVTLAATPEESARLALAASLGELRLWLRNPGDQERIAALNIRAADLDKPLPDPNKKEDPEARDPKEDSQPGNPMSKLILPPAPMGDKEDGKKPAEDEEPKRKGAKRQQADDDEEPRLPRGIQLNPTKPAKTHTMYIREGSKERKEQVRTRREDDEANQNDEDEGSDGPAPVKKEEKADPKNEQPKNNPPPAKAGSSTKTGRTRTGR
jgi:pilus assembly protein CpaB